MSESNDYPIAVRRTEVVEVEGEDPVEVLEIGPEDIIPEDYAKYLIAELKDMPQAWVYVLNRVLSRATPLEVIRKREGPNRMILNYVDGAYAIATRAALTRIGIASDLNVLQTDVSQGTVESLVQLVFKFPYEGSWLTTSSTQWGDCHIRGGMAPGDAKKGSVTDGLKKCLSEFGWAADVYTSTPETVAPPDPEELKRQGIETVYEIGKTVGLEREDVDNFVFRLKNSTLDNLSPADRTSVKRKLQKLEPQEIEEVKKNGL